MKKLILFAIVAVAALSASSARADEPTTYFQYPLVPDSVKTLEGRTTFLIKHFWDFCDLKKAFSSRAKMAGALKDYLTWMPYANPAEANKSMARFLMALEKQPQDQLFIAREAEKMCHVDTGLYYSDQIFLPFANAVANNKRIKAEDRAHFERMARVLALTMVNTSAPGFDYTDRTGAPGKWTNANPDSAAVTLLFFNDPTSSATNFARARLNASITTSKFIREGVAKIISVSTLEPGQEWTELAKSFPDSWTVVTSPQIDTNYDITFRPSFYILDEKGTILMKNADTNQVIQVMDNLDAMNNAPAPQPAPATATTTQP